MIKRKAKKRVKRKVVSTIEYVKPHPTILGAFVNCDKNDPKAICAEITMSEKPCNCCNFKKNNK